MLPKKFNDSSSSSGEKNHCIPSSLLGNIPISHDYQLSSILYCWKLPMVVIINMQSFLKWIAERCICLINSYRLWPIVNCAVYLSSLIINQIIIKILAVLLWTDLTIFHVNKGEHGEHLMLVLKIQISSKTK